MRDTRESVDTGALPKSRYGFLTLPQYSMIALTNAVEPLRMANSISGQLAYEWSIVSLDGAPGSRQQWPDTEFHQVTRHLDAWISCLCAAGCRCARRCRSRC